jgi:hypothetical protein
VQTIVVILVLTCVAGTSLAGEAQASSPKPVIVFGQMKELALGRQAFKVRIYLDGHVATSGAVALANPRLHLSKHRLQRLVGAAEAAGFFTWQPGITCTHVVHIDFEEFIRIRMGARTTSVSGNAVCSPDFAQLYMKLLAATGASYKARHNSRHESI